MPPATLRRPCVICPLAALVLCAGGCRLWSEPHEAKHHLLRPPHVGGDGAVLEIFQVRLPVDDPALGEGLWHLVDEQHVSLDERRRLRANGFRVGRLGGQIPPLLERLLSLHQHVTSGSDVAPVRLDAEPRVRKHLLQIGADRRSEITTSGVYDEMPVLTREGDMVVGRTYRQAQGRLAMKTFPQGDGRVRLRLVPEVHYGDTHNRFVAAEGMWRLKAGRPRKALDELSLEETLAPGEMLLLTTDPQRPGSIGHYFFTEPGGDRHEQKLIIIRLVRTPCDDLFDDGPRSTACAP